MMKIYVQIEMCYKYKIYTIFQRPSTQKNVKYFINNLITIMY